MHQMSFSNFNNPIFGMVILRPASMRTLIFHQKLHIHIHFGVLSPHSDFMSLLHHLSISALEIYTRMRIWWCFCRLFLLNKAKVEVIFHSTPIQLFFHWTPQQRERESESLRLFSRVNSRGPHLVDSALQLLNQSSVNLSTTSVLAVKHAHYAPLTPPATLKWTRW